MRPLSSTDCISPAIVRTKLILFSPFRMGRTWKLCATSYLCRMGTMVYPFPLILLAFIPLARSSCSSIAVAALLAGVLFATALYFYLFHLCSRLQFAFFDILVNRGEFVAPAWRKYGPPSRRWTAVKILLGIVVTFASAAPVAAYIHHVIPLFQSMQAMGPGQQPSPQIFAAFFAGYGIILLVFGSFFLVSSLLADFILPSLALENTSMAESFRRMFALIRQEPGEFALYTVLKVGLAIAAVVGATIVWEIAFFLCTLLIGVVVFLIGFLLHLIGVPKLILMVLGIALAIGWYIFSLFYAMLLALGPMYTFLDAYALYFLGGRYPLLGNLLEPTAPDTASTPFVPFLPTTPSPGEL